MKTLVNEDCIGCGMCVEVCPEVFQLDASGMSTVVGDPNEHADKVMQAAEICPVNAIGVEQPSNIEKICKDFCKLVLTLTGGNDILGEVKNNERLVTTKRLPPYILFVTESFLHGKRRVGVFFFFLPVFTYIRGCYPCRFFQFVGVISVVSPPVCPIRFQIYNNALAIVQ